MADTKLVLPAGNHSRHGSTILVPLNRSARLIVVYVSLKIVCGDIIYEKKREKCK